MRELRNILLLFFAALLSLTVWSYPAQSANQEKEAEKGASKPIVINSKTLEADNKKKTVTFKADVKAKMENFTVYCNKMVVYYEDAPEKNEKKGPGEGTKIDKIVASGDVKIIRAEGGVATGQKAVYYQLDEKLILTGKPLVKQGNNYVEGDRITLFLKEDRSVVESLKDKKVRAVIFPGKDKGQGLGRGK